MRFNFSKFWNNPNLWVHGVLLLVLGIFLNSHIESCNEKAKEEIPPATLQILPYLHQKQDSTLAKNIYDALTTTELEKIHIEWENTPVVHVSPPEIDSIYCTPSSAKHVRSIVELLHKKNIMRVDAIFPAPNQQSRLLLFGHNKDYSDNKRITLQEIDNAQALCTRKK
jgi:hypothetical protein